MERVQSIDDDYLTHCVALSNDFPEMVKQYNLLITIAKKAIDPKTKLDVTSHESFDRFLTARNILTLLKDDQLAQDFLYVAFDKYWLPSFRELLIASSLERPQVYEMLSRWQTLMPDRFLQKIVTIYVMPKLVREIQNCKSEKISWLMPWEGVVGVGQMRNLFENEYRPKISRLL